MGIRFRKRLKLFPGLSLNFSKNGLSSLSIGGPGATLNIPIARSGGARGTVGIPGSGFSYSTELSKPTLKNTNAANRWPDPNDASFKEWSDAYDRHH